MAEISIGNNHLPQIARWQHVLEWLGSERVRLESEHAHVVTAGARVQGELLSFLHSAYGVDPTAPIQVDSERGVLVVPDAPSPPAPEPEPEPEPDVQPMPEPAASQTRAQASAAAKSDVKTLARLYDLNARQAEAAETTPTPGE